MEHIIQEIKSVQSLLASRAACGSQPNACLVTQFAEALIAIINNTKIMTIQDVQPVIAALKDGPYGKYGNDKILAAIDAKLAQLAGPKHAKDNSAGQSLKEVWNYLTPDDWAFITDKAKFISAKMCRVVERVHSIGCVAPSESTYKWMLAVILLSHYDEMPAPSLIYAKLLELKQVAGAEKKSYALQQLNSFPAKPTDMPPDIYALAYPDAHPVAREMHGIHAVADRIPLRKNSKLLTDKKQAAASEACFAKVKSEVASKDPAVKQELGVGNPSTAVKQEAEVAAGFDKTVPMPTDDHEEHLLVEYKSGIWKHRAEKTGVLLSHAPAVVPAVVAPTAVPAMVATKTEHGALVLSARIKTEVPSCPAAHVPTDAAPPPPKAETYGETDLDPYAQAALKAFGARELKKKDLQADKRKQSAAAKKAAKGVVKSENRKSKKKSAKGVATSEDYQMVTAEQARSSCPEGDSPPLLYKTGIIYTVSKSNMFRALRIRGDKYTESSCGWGKSRTKQEAWTKVVQAIDKHRAAGKAKKGAAK